MSVSVIRRRRHSIAEITVFEKSGGPLTKHIALGSDGKIVNDTSACRMANGSARRVRIDTMPAHADLINGFRSHQAYTLGRLKEGLPDRVRVVRADKLNEATDSSVIARTKEYLVFKEGEPGLALLDGDFKGISDAAKRRMEECGGLWSALCRVLPELAGVAYVERASTSSGLRNRDTGETFPGTGGRHIVIPVRDAADIPRFLSDLFDRLWLAGLGWGMVSAAGSFLERAVIDKAVGSPERLIFEGAPIIEPPLEQTGRDALARDGAVLDTRSCPPLTIDEKAKLRKLKAAEERRLLPERLKARAAWSVNHIERLTADGMSEAEARALTDRWIDRKELSGAFPLPFDDPKIAGTTVAKVLIAPDDYIDKTLSDPFEGPDYGRGKAILYRRTNGSLFINSFAHGGVTYELKETTKADDDDQSDPFTELLAKAEALARGDDAGLKALIADMLAAAFSNERCDMLLRAAAKKSGFVLRMVRKLVAETKRELTEKERNTPEAREAERRAREAAEEGARIVAEAERQRLWQSCSGIALSKTLLADMEAFVHKLGVVGESASIRGTYLAAVSRLSKTTAVSYLRRGAPAGGKNHLIKAVLRLFPEDSVIEISSATRQALIYLGEDENDVNALKHKVIVIAEAAILARRANGDEHPMTGMLRILLSEGKLDHRIPVPQPGGTPKTVHVRRDGPVVLFITSAREDIEPEMLTRLLSSDADESGEQTLNVVDNILSLKCETVSEEEIERWCNFQRNLALNGPYEVAVPFSQAIARAYRELTKRFPATLQLRMRRDVSALKAAIEASAIVHGAQRQKDAAGRIIAEIADYENAHAAFNEGAAALYDLQPSEAVAATLKAVVEIARETKGEVDPTGEQSYKIVVEEVRRKLGVASKETASRRLAKAVDLGFLEEDEAKRGTGRGSPRFYKIRKLALDGQMGQMANVFPAASEVKNIWEGGEGSKSAVQNVHDVQESQAAAAGSCTSRTSRTAGLDPSPPPKNNSSAAFRTSSTMSAEGAMPTHRGLSLQKIQTPQSAATPPRLPPTRCLGLPRPASDAPSAAAGETWNGSDMAARCTSGTTPAPTATSQPWPTRR